MADVFPRRNLPGRAEKWGRSIESNLNDLVDRNRALDRVVDNGLRSNSGQAAFLTNQVDSLLSRATQLQVIPSLSITGGAQTEPLPRSETLLTFNPPPFSTSALIQFSGEMTTSNASVPHAGFLEVGYDIDVIDKTMGNFSRLAMKPAAWPNSLILEGFARVDVFEGTSPSFRFGLIRKGLGSSTVTTITVSNLSVSLTYSGPLQ